MLEGVSPEYLITWLLKEDMSNKLKYVYNAFTTHDFSHELFYKLVNADVIHSDTGMAPCSGSISQKSTSGTIKKYHKHHAMRKIVTGIFALAIIGGIIATYFFINKPENNTTSEVSEIANETDIFDGYIEMTEDDYEELICGGLSMRETEIMFECLWQYSSSNNIEASSIEQEKYLADLLYVYADELSLTTYDDYSTDSYTVYYMDKINNMFEALNLPIYTTINNPDIYWFDSLSNMAAKYINNSTLTTMYYFLENIDGNIAVGKYNDETYYTEYNEYNCHAEIVSAKYDDEKIKIVFKLYRYANERDIYYSSNAPVSEYINYEEAVFQKNTSGKYYLYEVHECIDDPESESTDTTINSGEWKDACKDILENDNNWGINSDYFSSENMYNDDTYFSTKELRLNYDEIISSQYTLITLSEETTPYLIIKRTYEQKSSSYSDEDNDLYCNLWYVYKYYEGEGFRCICELNNEFNDDSTTDICITVYNNKLGWYKYTGTNYSYADVLDLCYGGSTLSNSYTDSIEDLTAVKDRITYYDISDFDAIDNY